MALRTQTDPYVLLGDSLADLPPPGAMAQGTLFHEEATGSCRVLVIDPITGARAWEDFCGGNTGATGAAGPPGATGAAGPLVWPPYVVSATDPAATYQTIAGAQAAALANGHGPDDPTTIHLFQGEGFAEDVELRAGLALAGFQATEGAPQPVIAGSVTLADEAGPFLLTGIEVAPPAAGAICVTVGGAVGKTLRLERATLTAPATGQCLVSAAAAPSTVEAVDTTFDGAGPGKPVVQTGADNGLLCERCTVTVASPSTVDAFSLGGPATLRRCTVGGRTIAAGSTLRIEDGRYTATTQAVVTVTDGGFVVMVGGTLEHGTASSVANAVEAGVGGGSFQPSGVAMPFGHRIDPALTLGEVYCADGGAIQRWGAGGILGGFPILGGVVDPLTPYELYVVDTTGEAGPVTFILPPLGTSPPTKLLQIKNVGDVQALNVEAQPGELIDLIGALTVIVLAGDFATFAPDPDGPTPSWYRTA